MATNHMNNGTTNKFIVQQRQSIPLQAYFRPRGFQEVDTHILRQLAHEGSKVVSPTQWLPLCSKGCLYAPRIIPGTHFC